MCHDRPPGRIIGKDCSEPFFLNVEIFHRIEGYNSDTLTVNEIRGLIQAFPTYGRSIVGELESLLPPTRDAAGQFFLFLP